MHIINIMYIITSIMTFLYPYITYWPYTHYVCYVYYIVYCIYTHYIHFGFRFHRFHISCTNHRFAGKKILGHQPRMLIHTAMMIQQEPLNQQNCRQLANETVRVLSALLTVSCLCVIWIWPRAFLPKPETTMLLKCSTPSLPWARLSPLAQGNWWVQDVSVCRAVRCRLARFCV